MKYFIHDNVVHKYPVPRYCYTDYDEEDLYDESPKGYKKCEDCFGDEGDEDLV